MRCLMILAIFFSVGVGEAFDASSLVPFCSAPPAGDGWEGLGLTRVWRIDDGAGTNVACSYGGTESGSISGSPMAWASQGGLMSCKFNGDSYSLGTGKITVFSPSSTNCPINIFGNTTLSIGAWVWMNWFYTAGNTVLFGTSTTMSTGCYQSTMLGGNRKPYLFARTSSGPVTNDVAMVTGEWIFVAYAMYPREGKNYLFRDDTMATGYVGTGTNAFMAPSVHLLIGNGLLGGAVRDLWFKTNGTTNTCIEVWNATRAIYGK